MASAINILVQLARLPDGKRRVISISEITGMEGDIIATQEIFAFEQEKVDEDGKIYGVFKGTGIVSRFTEHIETALRNFEARFPNVADVKILCAAFIVQRETGGNLTMILEGLARAVRERFQLKRQVKALTAEGRITSLVLGVLPMAFAGITWILNPDYITILFSDPLGRRLLALAIALEIAGFTIMRLVSKIEV
ncbi:MAG: type II secretion system F family protein [Thermodesulfobacteriota bacterium]|nr:type II secretion system F family protein [Thermodesulfobacteriota bacterium]